MTQASWRRLSEEMAVKIFVVAGRVDRWVVRKQPVCVNEEAWAEKGGMLSLRRAGREGLKTAVTV